MAEVRTNFEGSLRYVQGSGSGTSWATASAPVTGLIGYVTNLTWTSAQDFLVVSDNGVPTHQKAGARQPITLSFDVQYGITAQYPAPATASGATVPHILLELRMSAQEQSAGSALYYQFYGATKLSNAFTHANPNTMTWTYQCLGMSGANGSGYIA